MAKQFFLVLCAGLACLFFTSTKLQAETSPSAYFPLAEGNRWVYDYKEYSREESSDESWEVLRQEESTFVLHITPGYLRGGGFEEFYVPTANGVGRFTYEPDPQASGEVESSLILKGPLQVGAKWQNGDGHYEITAINKTVTVPAGTFTDCVEITHQSPSGRVTVITDYAPGVGVVMRAETFPRAEGSSFHPTLQDRVVLKLKKWKVASPES